MISTPAKPLSFLRPMQARPSTSLGIPPPLRLVAKNQAVSITPLRSVLLQDWVFHHMFTNMKTK